MLCGWEALGIYFYEPTDMICDDWSVLMEGDEGYNEDKNLFSAILEGTDCLSGAIAIWCFECAECGKKNPGSMPSWYTATTP